MQNQTYFCEKQVPLSSSEKDQRGCVPNVIGVIGFGLCFTGFGIIIGIPILIWYFFWLIYNFFRNRSLTKPVLEGPCPYCGFSLYIVKGFPGADCPACNQRILVKEEAFETLPSSN
jgi:hypothetical protein